MNRHDKPCAICGLQYRREWACDRREHRARHDKAVRILKPKPNPQLAALHARHGGFAPLDETSPR